MGQLTSAERWLALKSMQYRHSARATVAHAADGDNHGWLAGRLGGSPGC